VWSPEGGENRFPRRTLCLLSQALPVAPEPSWPAPRSPTVTPKRARRIVLHPAGFSQFGCSLLIRHGESVKVVQARLGHASAAETLDTYSHLWPDSENRTRAAVDEVLGPRVSPTCHAGEPGTQNPWSRGW